MITRSDALIVGAFAGAVFIWMLAALVSGAT